MLGATLYSAMWGVMFGVYNDWYPYMAGLGTGNCYVFPPCNTVILSLMRYLAYRGAVSGR